MIDNNNEKLYNLFLSYSYDDLMRLFKNAKSKEEQDFYVTLSNLVNKYANLYDICRCKWSR